MKTELQSRSSQSHSAAPASVAARQTGVAGSAAQLRLAALADASGGAAQLRQLASQIDAAAGTRQLRAMQAQLDGAQSAAQLAASDDEPLQKAADEDDARQLAADEDESTQLRAVHDAPAQLAADDDESAQMKEIAPNRTGLPDDLKGGVESLSGMSLDNVRVHYNSLAPAELNAHAYAQGSDIHVAPGQEQHLPHEAWHVVQQAQGRVQPTLQAAGVAVNDDKGLEQEADVMGARALQAKTADAAR